MPVAAFTLAGLLKLRAHSTTPLPARRQGRTVTASWWSGGRVADTSSTVHGL